MKTTIPSSVSLDDLLASTSIPEHVENMKNVGVNPSSSASLTHEESYELKRSKRATVVKDFGGDFVTYNIEDDSVTFKDVMASLEAKQWKETFKSEMDFIVSNGTWVLVDLPPGCTTIGLIQVTRPEPTDTDPKTAEIAQWTERDQIGRGAILSALSNMLFDVYCSNSYAAKSLWDELDRKYNTEEQGLEKYYVSKFMRYHMVEDRSIA
ncbi:hypothetical protein Sango_3030300 [Sesamum angolense]|uniref:Uncharacterized protein n=1 Tax=Sesamum angolense TaxID=2727404 RepID=A0AAE1T2Y3_9LAMI|nr:hypothetical protein Sango_3030300 [Sesamum angolense]